MTALRGNGSSPNGAEEGDSSALYSVKQVETIAAFFSITFSQHVKGFQYVCSELQPEVIDVRSLAMQTPLEPCPLARAILPEKPQEDIPGATDEVLAADLAAMQVAETKAERRTSSASIKSIKK